MATLNVSLTLSSTDVSSDNLNMTVTDALTVGPPQEFLSKVVLEVNGGSDTVIKPAGSAGNHYLYVKHTGLKGDGSAATAAVVLKLGSTSLSVLVPGEISFFNVINSGVINAISSSSETILLEYGFFTKA